MTVAKLEKELIAEVKNFDFHIDRYDNELKLINERFDILEHRFDILYNSVEDIKVDVAYKISYSLVHVLTPLHFLPSLLQLHTDC